MDSAWPSESSMRAYTWQSEVSPTCNLELLDERLVAIEARLDAIHADVKAEAQRARMRFSEPTALERRGERLPTNQSAMAERSSSKSAAGRRGERLPANQSLAALSSEPISPTSLATRARACPKPARGGQASLPPDEPSVLLAPEVFSRSCSGSCSLEGERRGPKCEMLAFTSEVAPDTEAPGICADPPAESDDWGQTSSRASSRSTTRSGKTRGSDPSRKETRRTTGPSSSSLRRTLSRSFSEIMPSFWHKVAARSSFAHEVWIFFEEPDSSMAAKVYHNFMLVLIVLACLVPVVQTLPDKILSDKAYFLSSSVLDAVFLAEVCVRWAVSPSFSGFLLGFYNLLDLAIAGPFVLRIVVFSGVGSADGVAEDVLLCVVPVMRMIKALRGQQNFTLLLHTLQMVVEPLSVAFFMLVLIILTSSSAIYVAEPRDNVSSMPHAMWMMLITVSTVGYGDLVPVTDLGRSITCLVVLVGVLCMAMPVAIVGQAFTETWRNRTRILVVKRMRDRLQQWGYVENDLRLMFSKFDDDGSGELDVEEFEKMVATMRLGLGYSTTVRLFNVFDVDDSGALDVDEFIEGLALNKHQKNFTLW